MIKRENNTVSVMFVVAPRTRWGASENMPTKTRLLDDGNFVYSPEAPKNEAFLEYLDFADRLLSEWRNAREAWNRSPFSSELKQRKDDLDRTVSGFVGSFRSYYTIKRVKQDAAFLPVSQFLARYRPLRKPFSILHCNLEMPLHTVLAFRDYSDLAAIRAAIDEKAPFPWWQSGPHDRPCYLFGECVWEINAPEVGQSDEGLVLLFLEMIETHRVNPGPIGCGYASPVALANTEAIPEKVKVAVWRRCGGKCAICGRREGLEFDFVRPRHRDGSVEPENIRLLCGECAHEKSSLHRA
jgi:hypothetical protein